MKNYYTRITISAIALGVMLFNLACGPGARNVNQPSAQDQNQASNVSVARASDACDAQTDKPKKIKDKLDEKIENRNELKDQYDPIPSNPSAFRIHVRKSPKYSYHEALIIGKVGGNDAFKALADVLNDFDKKGCLQRVVFLSGTAFPPDDQEVAGYFEWTTCQPPDQLCSSGECMPSCPRITPPIANGNMNVNTNTNSNTSGNSNSNSNGNP